MHHLTDSECMLLFQQGNEEAYTVLYNRYARDVYRYAYLQLHNKEASEDIVQEAFIRVYRNRHQYDSTKSQFRTWVHRIANHLCIDHYRKEKNRTVVAFEADAPSLSKNARDQTASEAENRLLAQSCLQQLPELERSVLILAYYQGLSGKEIAEILNIPLGTVKSKLHYSLQKLQKWLKEENARVKVSVRFPSP